MLQFKKFVLPILAMVATVTLGSTQAALADHDQWRNGYNGHSRHSNQVVYRTHHNRRYYNNRNNYRSNYRNNDRYYNHSRSVGREVRHVLRHI